MNMRLRLLAICAWLGLCLCPDPTTAAEAAKARDILDGSGVRGGLVVHLGCGDGRLTAALHRGPAFLVHGLDSDPEAIREARRHIRSVGAYGPVSVERWTGNPLPYGDNSVNLVVAEEPGDISRVEMMRVLAPGGVACVRQGDTWRKEVKSRPSNVDEWTHYMHDASGNAVAHDDVVGPPRYMQWIAGPRHTRSHEHAPSINALVSSAGRIFYIADEGPISSVREPPQWRLVARDAYNGILLWKRQIPTWYPTIINWGQTPRHLQRRLVATADRLYVTLGLHAPVSVVEAATGAVLKVYDDTMGAEEIVLHDGVLLVATRRVTEDRTKELARFARLSRDKHSPLYERESAQPLVSRFRSTERKAGSAIMAFDVRTGRLLWQKEGSDTNGLRDLTLCAQGDSAFYQKGSEVFCLDLRSGRQKWSTSSAPLRFVHENGVVCATGKSVAVLSAETGRTRWTQKPLLTDVRDVFVAGGSLWLGGFKPFPKKRGPAWGPYFATQRDLATGEVLMHVEAENPGHHHRCYQNKATDRYILAGRRGTEFIDLATGEVREHSWARGVCKYGVMPCNGLMYAPPHACGCYVGTKVTGFSALAAAVSNADVPQRDRLVRGPAYEENRRAGGERSGTNDWATYRCDAERSGSTNASVPVALKPAWQRELGGRLSAPVVADGRVFVASVDEHTVHALDADSGQSLWDCTAAGRVDSAPTVFKDRVVFGSRDGRVYCLRASDGELAWRYEAARTPRRIVAHGQLESASPVHGSVLVHSGAVCFAAGRSSYLDGGIDLCRLDPRTGKELSRTPIYSPDPQTHKQPVQFAPSAMPGVRSDILTGDGGHIYLRDMVFDARGAEGPEGRAHLIALTDFLDDTWPHRSYWIYGTKISISTGCSGQAKNLTYGRLLVFDNETIYGYGRAKLHWSNQLQDGAYRLFATPRGDGKERWEKPVKAHVRAMALADKTLFVAGAPVKADTGPGAPETEPGDLLLAVAATDGAILARHRLPATPTFDAMAATRNRLFMSFEDGTVACLSGVRP